MRLLFVALSLIASGCTLKQKITPEQVAEIAATRPKCTSEKECAAKWNAAQRWIIANADLKIQVATDSVIETYSPSRNDAMRMGVRVVREIGPRETAFDVAVFCNGGILFECKMSPYQAAKSFNDYVNSALE